MIASPRSRIYRGRLRHRRFRPRGHAFTYTLWMAWIDLDELPELFDGVPGFSARQPALARFRREDYLRDDLAPHDRPLKQAVREEFTRLLGSAPGWPRSVAPSADRSLSPERAWRAWSSPPGCSLAWTLICLWLCQRLGQRCRQGSVANG